MKKINLENTLFECLETNKMKYADGEHWFMVPDSMRTKLYDKYTVIQYDTLADYMKDNPVKYD